MKFGSVCSGIEAASVAWEPLGWSAAWLSEIEPFPCAVLAHHWPEVPNLGDMTLIKERIRNHEIEAPEVFTGGTPCQAFSVAGKRGSLDDARGNLTLEFVRIADAIDDVRQQRNEPEAIIVWENVPGVLNTKDNAFGCFIAELAGCDTPIVPVGNGWTNAGMVVGSSRSVAWRTLDAQYFGLAQQRKRVFVIASARKDFDPSAVLFESDGLRRDYSPVVNQGVQDPVLCLQGAGKTSQSANGTTLKENIGFTLNLVDRHGIVDQDSARLLLPIENERLQGFPDNHTLVNFKGEPASDELRNKAIGNSWAAPCARWIGERIQQHLIAMEEAA